MAPSPKQKLERVARRAVVKTLSRVNPGDVTVRHHWTGRPLRLHSFRHKGYWFHGSNRERETMITLARLLRPGDVVIEVGGHIGYLASWIADLIGPSGHIDVFEPGPNNLPYLRVNLAEQANTTIREVAVGGSPGVAPMLIEELTGQNNSLDLDGSHFRRNSHNAGVDAPTRTVEVEVVTLDGVTADLGRVDLVKIDVEGLEADVLAGATEMLRSRRPIIVIEISRRHAEAAARLSEAGYVLRGEDLAAPLAFEALSTGNYVALHPDAHAELLSSLPL